MRNKRQMQTKELQKTTWQTRLRRLAIAGGLVALTAVPMGYPGHGGISRVSAASGDVKIDEAHFPDEQFRAYISYEFDENHDGVLSKAEIKKVTEIDFGHDAADPEYDSGGSPGYIYGCKDITGIEIFTELRYLYTPRVISKLDVSKFKKLEELDCAGANLKQLDVSKNPKLKILNCTATGLKKLDVSKNPELETLYCGAYYSDYTVKKDNSTNRLRINRLTKLDVSKNPKLEYLDCSGNLLTKLDISKNSKLEYLNCFGNRLTKLDVSRNTALTYLNCSGNRLTKLDISKNPELQYLYCHENKLTSLDIRKNTQLIELNCRSNKLKKLDLTKNIRLGWLNCYNNKLTKLDTSHNSGLRTVYCENNKLTKLDVSKNPFIQELCYDNNKLKKVTIPESTVSDSRYNNQEHKNINEIEQYNEDKVSIVKKKVSLKKAKYLTLGDWSRYYVTGEGKNYKTVRLEHLGSYINDSVDGSKSWEKYITDFVLEKQKYVVTEIGANAFYGNYYKHPGEPAGDILVGESVKKIGSKAFADTKGIGSITTGKELKELGSYVFANSNKLKTITIKSTKLTSKTVDKKAFAGIKASTTIKVPKSKLAAYKKLFRKCGLNKKVKIKAI